MDLCKLGKDHVQSRTLDDDFVKERELQASWTQFKHAQYGESKVEQSLVTKTDVFLSVFGGQVWTVENAAKNASVDEKLFIRFQETENRGFRKRISVDRALGLSC